MSQFDVYKVKTENADWQGICSRRSTDPKVCPAIRKGALPLRSTGSPGSRGRTIVTGG